MIIPKGKYEFWWLMTAHEFPCPPLSSIIVNGYSVVYGFAHGHETREPEHRIIMEEWLCRKLGRLELVHHINGDRQDNRLQNLQLTTPKEHICILHHRKSGWHHTPETLIKLRSPWWLWPSVKANFPDIPETSPLIIAPTLRAYMEKRGIKKQSELVRSTGLSASIISGVLGGKRRLSETSASILSQKTGIPMEELFQ